MEIRGFTVKYSKRKAKKRRDKEVLLQRNVNELQAQAEQYPRNKNTILELELTKSRLRRITTLRTKCIILNKTENEKKTVTI